MAGGSPEEFAVFIRDDLAKWERVAGAAGLKRATAAQAQIIVAQHSPPPSRSDDANPSRRVTRLYPALSAAERRVSCWHPSFGG